MPKYEIVLSGKQIKKILEVLKPNLDDHSNEWEELEIYTLKGSNHGTLWIYFNANQKREIK